MPSKQIKLNSDWVGQVTVIIYLLSFLLPIKSDLLLFLLSGTTLFVVYSIPMVVQYFSFSHTGLLMVFLLLLAISIIASSNTPHSLWTSAPFLPGVLLFFLVVTCFRSLDDLERLYFSLSVLVMGVSLLLLEAGLERGIYPPIHWVRGVSNSMIVVPNDTILLSVIAPFSLVVLLKEPRSIRGILAGLSILVSGVTIVLIQSRGAFLIFAFCLTLVLTGHCKLTRGILISALGAVVLLILDGLTGFEMLGKFIHHREARFSLWAAAWSMFLERPWLGYGPNTFLFHYQEFFPFDSGGLLDTRRTPWAHNLYLELLAEQGVFVTISFIALVFTSMRAAWKTTTSVCRETHRLGLGVAASLSGFALGAVFELSFIRIWVVLVMLLLLAIINNLSIQYSKGN